MVVTGMITNIRGMVRDIIKGMIISFAAVLVLQTLMLAMNMNTSALINSVLATSGLQSSSNALLFWFLFTAIIAFFYSQALNHGIRTTLKKFTTLPGWIGTSVKTTGITAFPLVMAGIAIALIARLYLLTALTGIQFLVLMIGILYSQQESLAILAMRLVYSDLHRAVKKTGPALPAPGFAVMGVVGAFAGFLIVLFIANSPEIIAFAVILVIAGSAAIWYRRKKALPAGRTLITTLIIGTGRLP